MGDAEIMAGESARWAEPDDDADACTRCGEGPVVWRYGEPTGLCRPCWNDAQPEEREETPHE